MKRKKINGIQRAYLTKRILIRSARAGGSKAAKEAMKLMGYIIVSENGWIVKKYADGRTKKIKPIASTENLQVVFD
jgi:hypothetical protein